MQDRVPLYPGRVKLTPVSGQTDLYDMERADQPTVEGTPLNKATFLTDAVAALYGLSGNTATINDVLSILTKAALLNSNESAITNMDGDELLTIPGVRIATGSYVGTGTYGADNPCTLTFDFTPRIVFFDASEADHDEWVTPYIWGALYFVYRRYQLTRTSFCYSSTNGSTLSWYTTKGTADQINSDGQTYRYLIIG